MDDRSTPRTADTDAIRHISASAVMPEEVGWALDQPMIPQRGITLIAGFRGATKTTLVAWVAAQVTAGGGSVFFASQEDDTASFIRPRIEAAGADLDRVRFPATGERLRFPRDAERLYWHLQRNPAGMVILDPLSVFITSTTNPTTARTALDSLAEISRQTDTGIVLVHHLIKSARSDPFAAIAGASALIDLARAVYLYGASDPDTAADFDRSRAGLRVLACVKLSAGALPPSLAFELSERAIRGLTTSVPRLELLGETSISAENLFATWTPTNQRRDRPTPSQLAETLLMEILADGPRPSADVIAAAKQAGISQRTFARARDHLNIQTHQSHGKHWMQLPDPPDTVPHDWE